MVMRTEHRVSRMLVFVRIATSFFAYFPLFIWGSLAHPWPAVVAGVSASAEAAWFTRRVLRVRTLRDPLLVGVDVVFCVTLMLVGTRAASPHMHNAVATELIPTVLAGAAIVGFGFTFGLAQIGAVAAMMAGWVLAVVPDVTLKLPSDLLGFALWYGVAALSMREFRTLALLTDQAHDAAQKSAEAARESEAEAEAARQRERVHREVHGHLLPIVERLIAGETVSERFLRDARRAARQGRRLIEDPRAVGAETEETGGFAAMLHETIDSSADLLHLSEPVLVITVEPPRHLAEALCGAVAEALRNVIRHAGVRCQVNLYVESTAEQGQIVVRDRGPGFDPATVTPGGGFTGTFTALRGHGAEWSVDSSPGQGTTLTITWPPRGPYGR
jgi:signal transduction histidine kinase